MNARLEKEERFFFIKNSQEQKKVDKLIHIYSTFFISFHCWS